MPTFSRVVLSDGKPAIRVDGLPDSPIFARVRKVKDELLRPEPTNIQWILWFQAYQVDTQGQSVGLEAPPTANTSRSPGDTQQGIAVEEWLKQKCLDDFVLYYQQSKRVGTIPSEVIV